MTCIPETCRGTCDLATRRIGEPGTGNGEPCTCRTPEEMKAFDPFKRERPASP